MSFQISVEGLDELRNGFKEFSNQIQDAVDDGLREGGEPIVLDLMTYPPYEMGSSYTRTFNYMQSITPIEMTVVSPGVFEASGHMPYDIFLRGTSDGSYPGAYMHVGRWETLVQIALNRLQGVRDAIDRKIGDLAARLGL